MTDMRQQGRETASSSSHPLVSAVLAVRNEERHIEAALRSLLHQDTSSCSLEIIVVDGGSSDSTREIVQRIASTDSRVKLAINVYEKTPCAFNIGIENSQGEYICILGAHTTYSTNYIATCLAELHRYHAAGCSGCVITKPGRHGLQAQLIAWCLAHSFGTSTGSIRTKGAGYADTIPYPVFLKRALLEVGGYNPKLHRNQDNDLNQRLRGRGYKLYMTDKTLCEYYVSPDLPALARYIFESGRWTVISLKQNLASMSLRHLVPGVFAFALFLSAAMFLLSSQMDKVAALWLRLPLITLGAAYGCASLAATTHLMIRERTYKALLAPIVFLVLHLSYGIGTLSAALTNAEPPPFDSAKQPTFRAAPDLIEHR